MAGKRSISLQVALGVLAGFVGFALVHFIHPRAGYASRWIILETNGARFELRPGGAGLVVRSGDGSVARDVELMLVVDGSPLPLSLQRIEADAQQDLIRGVLPVASGDVIVEANVEIRA